MPLPLAHSLIGVAVCVATDEEVLPRPGHLLAAVVLANGADLDYLPGFFLGDPHRFHRMATHSIGFSLLVGALAAALVGLGWLRPWRLRSGLPRGALGTGLIVAALWATHIVLDSLNADYSEPVGQMLLWPLSNVWVPAVLPIFYNVDKVAGPATPVAFVLSLVNWHNVRALVLEFVLTAPILALAVSGRRRR